MYKKDIGNIANKDKVIDYLTNAYNENPGNWVIKSYIIGEMAKNMAEKLGLDPDIAFCIGSLHKIGKSRADKLAYHLEGYKILRADSYFFPSRIAISHGFVIKDISYYQGDINISQKDYEFLKNYLGKIQYNDYDLSLIHI